MSKQTPGARYGDPTMILFADQIHKLSKRRLDDAIAIGSILHQAKEYLGHGGWLAWLGREFNWSDETARKFMRVHDLVKSQPCWNLATDAIDLSAVYVLARPSTPPEAVDEVVKLTATERVPLKTVQAIIAAHKPASPPKPAESDDAIADRIIRGRGEQSALRIGRILVKRLANVPEKKGADLSVVRRGFGDPGTVRRGFD